MKTLRTLSVAICCLFVFACKKKATDNQVPVQPVTPLDTSSYWTYQGQKIFVDSAYMKEELTPSYTHFEDINDTSSYINLFYWRTPHGMLYQVCNYDSFLSTGLGLGKDQMHIRLNEHGKVYRNYRPSKPGILITYNLNDDIKKINLNNIYLYNENNTADSVKLSGILMWEDQNTSLTNTWTVNSTTHTYNREAHYLNLVVDCIIKSRSPGVFLSILLGDVPRSHMAYMEANSPFESAEYFSLSTRKETPGVNEWYADEYWAKMDGDPVDNDHFKLKFSGVKVDSTVILSTPTGSYQTTYDSSYFYTSGEILVRYKK